MTGDLRKYRQKARLMGQTSPLGLGHDVMLHVVGNSVADVGCGSGVVGYALRSAWEFTEAWEREAIAGPTKLIGVDWSPATIEALQRCNPFDEVHLADARGVPLADKSVDTAVSMENLEHLLPGDVPGALAELARIARRRVVISTPTPWSVINVGFLDAELAEAEADQTPMGYGEYVDLVGRLHKSSVTPEQMRAAGFESEVNRLGAPAVSAFGAIIYTADPAKVDVTRLGPVAGVPWVAYPEDDDREDWRSAYVQAVRDSRAVKTPRTPPAKSRISAVLKGVRSGLRG